jgi:hypothetical protein
MVEVARSEMTALESSAPALSWSAIVAGAFAAAALTLVLVALGSAVGFSALSPWSDAGISAQTFQIAGGLYLVVIALLASTVGGYISGRLRTKWRGVHNDEVLFRDTAHGFLAWALALLLGAAALGGAATYLAGGAAKQAGAATSDAQSIVSPYNYYAEMLFRLPAGRASATAGGGAAPIVSREARVILAHSTARTGDLPAEDRAYLARLVSAQTGLSEADAEKRVAAVLDRAKAEADRARKSAAAFSIWLTISMFVGAFAASLAAIEGGQLRDRRWKGVIGTRAYREARIEN